MLGISWGSFAFGAVAGVVGSIAFSMIDHATPGKPSGAPGTNASGMTSARLHGKVIPTTIGAPSPYGQAKAGYATVPPYEWGYVVGPGDSSGSIAEAVTGDDSRYTELVMANPQVPTAGELGVYLGDKQWDFQPGALKVGTNLLLPLPWFRYIDQVGNVRGGTTPYPTDPRAAGMMMDDGASVPSAMTGSGSVGNAPYGAPFTMGAAA